MVRLSPFCLLMAGEMKSQNAGSSHTLVGMPRQAANALMWWFGAASPVQTKSSCTPLKVSLLERPFDHGERQLLQSVTDLQGDDRRTIGEAVEDLRFVRRHLTATDDEDATAVDTDRDR